MGAQMQRIKAADLRRTAPWWDERCHASHRTASTDDRLGLPSSSITQPVISDPLCGPSPHTRLAQRVKKENCSPFDLITQTCVSYELRRDDHFGGGCWRSIKDPYPPLRESLSSEYGIPLHSLSSPTFNIPLVVHVCAPIIYEVMENISDGEPAAYSGLMNC